MPTNFQVRGELGVGWVGRQVGEVGSAGVFFWEKGGGRWGYLGQWRGQGQVWVIWGGGCGGGGEVRQVLGGFCGSLDNQE